jgi:sigma-B regulation protein RsbU (phosphoserine phosphatase)
VASPRVTVRFRERRDLLDFFLEIATLTSQTLDLDELLASIAAIVGRVIPWDLFAILLYNEKSDELRIRYAVGHNRDLIGNISLKPGEGIAGTAAATREPVLVRDVRADPRYLNVSTACAAS